MRSQLLEGNVIRAGGQLVQQGHETSRLHWRAVSLGSTVLVGAVFAL